MDALGGKFDPNAGIQVCESRQWTASCSGRWLNQAGSMLNTAVDTGSPSLTQQWSIVSNNDGYFQIASLNPGSGSTKNVLDNFAGSTASRQCHCSISSYASTEPRVDVISATEVTLT